MIDCETERLIQAFETCTLPREHWTHQAHLAVGLWYVSQYSYESALEQVRQGIQRYNETWGIQQTSQGGYHETLTCFYIWLIDQFLLQVGETTSLAELAQQLFKYYGGKNLPLQYWSRERLFSWEARIQWLEPDLRPLELILAGESAGKTVQYNRGQSVRA